MTGLLGPNDVEYTGLGVSGRTMQEERRRNDTMSMSVNADNLDLQRSHDERRDRALVEQARTSDIDAFGRIIDVYNARLYGFVLRMVRNEEEALDITQETFIRAYQSLKRFDGRSSLRTWLFRIAQNLCIDRARKIKRNPIAESVDWSDDSYSAFEMEDGRNNPEQTLLHEELHMTVEDAIGMLSDKLREVLLLHDGEGMGYEEIAKTLAVPVGTVKSRLFLARQSLKKQIGIYRDGELL